MPISEAYKKISTAWANTGDRTDPDDSSLMPALAIATGWPQTFSSDDGFTPRRRVFNEMYNRRDSALIDIRNYGILPWDTE